MPSAAKKFTARNLPALLALAAECKLESHKVDSKTYQFFPGSIRNDYLGLVGLSCEDMQTMETFAGRVVAEFAAYDLDADSRGRFVSVTWAKRTARTQSQIDNMD